MALDGMAKDNELAIASPDLFYYGGKFTYYNPSDLVRVKGLKIFTEMRKDDQIKAAMGFKKLAVLSSGWKILPPAGKNDDDEPTRFVSHCLRNMDGALVEDLREILTAMEYGYSVSEKIYAPVKSGEFAGKIGLKRIKTKSPDTFEFNVDMFGNLTGLSQNIGSRSNVPMPLHKFAIYSFDAEFGNPYGRSELESAYRAYWCKDNAYKWMLMFLERHGIPPIMLMFSKNISQSDQNRMQTILKNMQAGTVAMLPRLDKDDLQFHALELSDGLDKIFKPAIQIYNGDIARALLMPSLVGLTDDNSQGSYARSTVHFDSLMMIVDRIRKCDIETRVMNEQVIPFLVDLNYPSVSEYPTFEFERIQDSTRFELLKLWKEMVSVRTVIAGDEDEKHIRMQLGFPQDIPEPEDKRSLANPAESRWGDDPTLAVPKPIDPDETQPMPVPAKKEAYAMRPMTSYEKKIDFAAIKETLIGNVAASIKEIRAGMTAFVDACVAKIRKGFDADPFELVKAIDSISTKLAEKAIDDMIDRANVSGREHVRDEMKGKHNFAENNNPGVKPAAAIKYLRAKKLQTKTVTSDAARNAVKQAILSSIRSGDGTEETVQRVRDSLEPFTGGEDYETEDGEEIPAYRIEAIVRTTTTEAYNQGRLTEMRELGELIIPAVQYSAILDERTTEICEGLHGHLFKLNDPELDRFTPPNHISCRSVLIELVLDEDIDVTKYVTPALLGKLEEKAGKGFV